MAKNKTADVVRQRVVSSLCAAMATRMMARRPPLALGRPKLRSAKALGTYAIGSFAIGAFALGALAIGNVVIGRLGIARLRLREGHIKHLRIDELEVGRLRVLEPQAVATPNGNKAQPIPEVAPV